MPAFQTFSSTPAPPFLPTSEDQTRTVPTWYGKTQLKWPSELQTATGLIRPLPDYLARTRGLVNAVRSITDGDENGSQYVEIRLLLPEYVYVDDGRLDEVYLAFQMIESGEMVVTVSAHPDRLN